MIGDYIQDDLSIAGVTLHNMTMAVATHGDSSTTGVMGLALDDEETLTSKGEYYYGLLDQMYRQDIIASKAYSLYLDDIGSGHYLILSYDLD